MGEGKRALTEGMVRMAGTAATFLLYAALIAAATQVLTLYATGWWGRD